MRLEFMGILGQCGEVANAVVARPALKHLTEGQRRQRGEPTSTASGDDQAGRIYSSAIDQKLGTVDTVVNIDAAPVQVQAVAVRAAVAGAATVVDVEHGDTSAGPELDTKTERR